jgi:hypothetical protein
MSWQYLCIVNWMNTCKHLGAKIKLLTDVLPLGRHVNTRDSQAARFNLTDEISSKRSFLTADQIPLE